MDRSPVVITGAQIVTCLGTSRQETWRAVAEGRCGMGPLTALESPLPPGKVGGQAVELPPDYEPDAPREVRYLKWTIQHALLEALSPPPTAPSRHPERSEEPALSLSKGSCREGQQSSISQQDPSSAKPPQDDIGAIEQLPYAPARCGILLGTTLHGMRAGGQFLRTGEYAPLHRFLAGDTLRASAQGFIGTAFAATTCSACSSSLGSVALAVTLLQTKELDLVVCGGYDTISEYAYGGFNSLRLVADGPLRPFAKDRQGMKLGEGYGILVLERADSANARGVTVLAQILGWGESADAHHLTQPHPEGDGAARAVLAALEMARLSPAQIGMIAAHATGTPDNDAAEYAAFKRVFGDALPHIPVVGFKSHLGHTLGGAGAVELILAMTALREQTVPPCANITPDEVEFPNLRLNTGTAKPAPIRTTLNTSLGFGGANTCVILGLPPDRHPEEALPTKDLASNEQLSSPRGRIPSTSSGQALRSAQDDGLARSNGARDVLITGVGVIVPGAIGNDAFISRLASESPPAWLTDGGAIPEDQFIHLLNARRIRRMSDQVKLTLAATAIACQDAAIADLPAFAQTCGAILGSTHGSAHYSLSYYGEIIRQGLVGANPMLFAEGVPNACSAHLSLMLAVKGACQTVIGTRTAALDALRLASLRIAAGDWDRAIVAAAEEYCDVINQTYRCCGLYAGAAGASAPFAGQAGFTTASAAVAFILESRQSLESRGASKARGRILDGASSRGNSDDPAAAAREVLTRLGPAEHAITSANGTWIDRAELAALRKKRDRAVLSSIYGHVPETFSCTPLLGISAALLTGRMPKLRSDGPLQDKGVRAAGGHERPASIIALCTDYTGVVTGMRMGLDVEGGATRQ